MQASTLSNARRGALLGPLGAARPQARQRAWVKAQATEASRRGDGGEARGFQSAPTSSGSSGARTVQLDIMFGAAIDGMQARLPPRSWEHRMNHVALTLDPASKTAQAAAEAVLQRLRARPPGSSSPLTTFASHFLKGVMTRELDQVLSALLHTRHVWMPDGEGGDPDEQVANAIVFSVLSEVGCPLQQPALPALDAQQAINRKTSL